MIRKLVLFSIFISAGFCSDVPTEQTAARLRDLLQQKKYVELEQGIDGRLTPADGVLFNGIIANRKNRVDESIKLLEPLATQLALRPPSWRERELLKALADDYSKAFEYAKSADTFSALLNRYGKQLSRREHLGNRNRRDEMQLLRTAPPQTVQLNTASMLQGIRTALGWIEVPVEANGKNELWVLDTGANTSVVTESTARRIGLDLLDGAAQTTDINGSKVSFRIGVLLDLKIGNAVLHNVELPVATDAAFNIEGYQMRGIIGFPVQSALKRITISSDAQVGINSEAANAPGSEMFMEEQTPIAVAKVAGADRLFSLDTGALGSQFGVRFYRTVRSQLTRKMRAKIESAGAGGMRHFRGYKMDRLNLSLGGQDIVLPSATILAEPFGSDLDTFFGNLGQDVFRAYGAYTIDFQNMTFKATK